MKKIIILIILIILTGCNNSTENNYFQSNIIKNNNSYNYEQYNNIKRISKDFELALLDEHIVIKNISFEIAKYSNDYYKTVLFTLDNNISIRLKFNDNENLMLLYLYNTNDEKDIYYQNAILASAKWKYFNFTYDEQNKIYLLNRQEITIGKYEIEKNQQWLIIVDTNYQ